MKDKAEEVAREIRSKCLRARATDSHIVFDEYGAAVILRERYPEPPEMPRCKGKCGDAECEANAKAAEPCKPGCASERCGWEGCDRLKGHFLHNIYRMGAHHFIARPCDCKPPTVSQEAVERARRAWKWWNGNADDDEQVINLIAHFAAQETAALRAELEVARKKYDALHAALEGHILRAHRTYAALDDYENREAAICPEDVGFEEFIELLQKRLGVAEAELARVRDGLSAAKNALVDYGLDENAANLKLALDKLNELLNPPLEKGKEGK